MNYPVWKSNGVETIMVHDMVHDAMLGEAYKIVDAPRGTIEPEPVRRGPGRPKRVA